MHPTQHDLDSNRPTRRFDVIVVGAGQAGLAMGYFLARQGRRFVILDGADSIGSAWRARWDSLTLFTPRRDDALPGLAFSGDPDGYPGRGEVVEYLETYAKTFALPIELNRRVRRLQADDGEHRLEVDGEVLAADQVVVATGPFQTPYVPDLASALAPEVVQMHSTAYRNPRGITAGTVLVVGGGNPGFQIAKELSAPQAVIWATGYRPDYSWIDAPILRPDGRLRHRRGVTDVPGLYFLGLSWQHTRGSALLGWVKDDAEFLADVIADRSATLAGAEGDEAALAQPRPEPITQGA